MVASRSTFSRPHSSKAPWTSCFRTFASPSAVSCASLLRPHGDRDAGARHRRDDRDLQRRQRGAPAAAAVPASPTASSASRTCGRKTGLRAATRSRRRTFTTGRRRARASSDGLLQLGGQTSVTLGAAADYADVFRITPGFFEALGAHAAHRPAAGDGGTEAGRAAGGRHHRRVLEAAVQRRPAARGIDASSSADRIFTIVGVLEPGIRLSRARRHLRAGLDLARRRPRARRTTTSVIARLRDGVAFAQAQAEMTAIAQRLEAAVPETQHRQAGRRRAAAGAARRRTRGRRCSPCSARSGSCCSSPARTSPTCCSRAPRRASARWSCAPRSARRAAAWSGSCSPRARCSASPPALLGAWLARLGMLALVALAPANLPRLDEIRVDAVGARLRRRPSRCVASLLFGLAPALQASRVQLVDGLRQGGKGSSIGARGGWARNAFVVAEIALAVVLVVGAGLLGAQSAARSPPSTWASRRSGCSCCAPRCRSAASRTRRARRRSIATCCRSCARFPASRAAAAVTGLPTAGQLERRLLDRGRSDVRADSACALAAGDLHRRDARLLPDDGHAAQARPRLHRRRSRERAARRDHQRGARARVVPRARIRSAGGSSAASTPSTS